jgi:hypothetical protein
LGRLHDLGGQQSLLDQKDIGIKSRTLVTGPNLRHHAIYVDNLASGEEAFESDDIVELKKTLRVDPHPKLERGGIFGADDPANRSHIHLFHFHLLRGYQRGVTGPGNVG